jgi:hypothetical protein
VATFVLVHSPLVGPSTWSPVQDELEARGKTSLIPRLAQDDASSEPYWSQHSRSAAAGLRGLPPDEELVFVGHSGAGVLLPAIAGETAHPVACYVFVDAELPHDGRIRAHGPFFEELRLLYEGGGAYPNWTDAGLERLVPDTAMRRRVLDEMRPQPWRFWTESVPAFEGWDAAPCAFLRFYPNPGYDDAAREAKERGWPCAEIRGHHFHMLVDPAAVTDAILDLVRRAQRSV